jgi:paraquat-inducible protein B
MRAELALQSFVTGKLYVGLVLKPETPVNLLGGTDLPEIPTVETDLERLARSLTDLPIKELVRETLATIEAVKGRVTDPRVDRIYDGVVAVLADLDEQIARIADSTAEGIDEARGLVRNIDGEVDPLFADLRAAVADLRAAIQGMSRTIESEPGLAYRMNETLDELTRTAQAVRALAEMLERRPESLIKGK